MGVLSLLTVAATIGTFAGTTPATGVPTHTKQNAEQNVLRTVVASWGTRRLSALADSRTRLLRNNVQAICHARSARRSTAHARFTCVVRRGDSRHGPRLFLSYRALAGGRFRAHWIRLRRH